MNLFGGGEVEGLHEVMSWINMSCHFLNIRGYQLPAVLSLLINWFAPVYLPSPQSL